MSTKKQLILKEWMRKWVITAALMIITFFFLCFPSDAQVTQLTLGVPLTGQALTSSTDFRYYSVHLTENEHLSVFVDKLTAWSGSLYIRYEALPTESDYDARSYRVRGGQAVEIPVTHAGTYYVMLRGDSYSPGYGNYSIVAHSDTTWAPLTLGVSHDDSLIHNDDADWFRVQVGAGEHGSTRIRGVRQAPVQITSFIPISGSSTFLRPDIGVGGEGMAPLEVLPHESTLTQGLVPFINTLVDQEFVERYVYNIVFSPNYAVDHTIFVAVWGSGLYKSVDQGNTWVRIETASERDHQMTGLALSPFYSVDSTIFAGFYDRNRSKDGGLTWEKLGGGNERITDFALSPDFINDSTVYVTHHGHSPYRNTTGGDGWWEPLDTGHFFNWCVALSPNFANDSTLFVGSAGGGIKRSRDRGDTWEHVSGGDAYWVEYVHSIEISPDFQQDSTVFAATSDYGVLKSVDGGSSWSAVNNGLSNLVCRTLALSPSFSSDDTIFLGTADGIFKSADAGNSWLPMNNGLTTPYIHTIAISPNFADDQTLLAGTEEGLFKSIDGGLSWFPANSGLQVATIPNITQSPFIGDVQPSIAIGSNGVLHLAWLGLYADATAPDGVVEDIFYMKRGNGVWSNPVIITAPTGYYAKNLSLAVDKDGHPHVAFRRSTHQSLNLTEDDIYYTFDYGSGFLDPPIMVVDGRLGNDWEEHPLGPSLAIDSAGFAQIAYLAGYTGNVWYTTNQSGSFNTPIQVISDSMRSLGVDLSVGADSKVHLAIEAVVPGVNTQSEIYYINNLSGNFSTPLQISEDGGDTPIILLDSLGKVHIAFYYFPFGGSKQVGYVTNKTGSFGSPQYIQGYHHPSMALDFNDNVHIAAQQQTFSPSWAFPINQIGYANNIGGQFVDSTITELDSGIATAQRRYIAVSPDDSVHIVYANGTVGGYDIFHLFLYPNSPLALAVTKQADPDPVRAGAQLTYTIRVTNTGNVDLHATVSDTLPAQVTPGGVLTWTPTITAPGGVWMEQVVVTVTTDYSGTLTNVVQVTTDEGATGVYTETSEAASKGTDIYYIYLPLVLKNH